MHPRQSQPVPRENESARDPVDVIIGRRLRARRQSLGLSQRKLGEILGVSFQQVQKYERGTNRIAVTILLRAATALEAPMSFFFEGVGPKIGEPEQPMLHRRDTMVAQALAKIEDRKVRAAFRTLIRALAQG
ncbi:helix-turn-helix transcriptional regulator [Mesorhizobium camelthorni]|uniref:Helix-turn-helix transcriptional regulator n=1 Tax=Allomesorhizobium camelthorni TaxID=475069 RepID=A0A6G4WMP9_9HYPH|nr:helix-turn-helix transcriptional regulator [Mesorhizobium camelthorni]